MSDQPAMPHPAATVVLLRDRSDTCEVLLVQRNVKLAFHGGAWVFPGGRVDRADYAPAAPDDHLAAARRAAIREAREEAGLAIAANDLVLVSRWITPAILPKRFDTWFFAAGANGAEVEIDGGEIHAYRWIAPDQALAARHTAELELPPPTFVTLLRLAGCASVREALARFAGGEVETFIPRVCAVPGGACTVYQEDVAYETGDLDAPGPRHRLVMLPSGWRYERCR